MDRLDIDYLIANPTACDRIAYVPGAMAYVSLVDGVERLRLPYCNGVDVPALVACANVQDAAELLRQRADYYTERNVLQALRLTFKGETIDVPEDR